MRSKFPEIYKRNAEEFNDLDTLNNFVLCNEKISKFIKNALDNQRDSYIMDSELNSAIVAIETLKGALDLKSNFDGGRILVLFYLDILEHISQAYDTKNHKKYLNGAIDIISQMNKALILGKQ